MPPAGSLTAEQLNFFDANGYLVLEPFSGEEDVLALRGRMAELIAGLDDGGADGTQHHRAAMDDYCFKSADNISFFYEGYFDFGKFDALLVPAISTVDKAFGDDGCLKQPKELSIRFVGHALHEHDPVFKRFSFSENISSVFPSLGYKRPAIVQSRYIFKLPGVGSEAIQHQDNTYILTEPPSCTGLWLALEDATVNNGCLWAIPGSHKNGLKTRMIRDENGTYFDRPTPSYDHKEFVPLEVKSGGLVLIFYSTENLSPTSRHAFVLHVVDTEGCEWSKGNWLVHDEIFYTEGWEWSNFSHFPNKIYLCLLFSQDTKENCP
ncbi:phytanoyl-CoA dioxygenase 1-like isoform X1 [Panicum miliaceum]|uniref:Phytanoyl-CoA dioxygenase 1-like isoform X1 n=1 Tax=Panicum miliaceum TaxID=4540 RepID=A0A3L6TLR4_PANMI|nr:phytanoyl-CoA dioxygenase 1-like isoform X1 [Panicum miliaceum]